MTKGEKLNNLYELVSGGGIDLTTKQLNDCGLNSKDINYLTITGVINKVNRGVYIFNAIHDLYNYGLNKLKLKEWCIANKCFQLCYKIDNNHINTNYQLLYNSISSNDYSNAFIYLENLKRIDSNLSIKDYNFILYLLNNICFVPNEYKEYIKKLTFQDISVDFNNPRYTFIAEHNKFRAEVFAQNVFNAYSRINDLWKITDEDLYIKIIQKLVKKSIYKELEHKKYILDLAITKDYESIITYIEQISRERKMNLVFIYMQEIANVIIKVQQTKEVPTCNNFNPNNKHTAMRSHNYHMLLKHLEKENEKLGRNIEENPFYVLVLHLCELIDEINKTNANITQDEKQINDNLFPEIINYLTQNDIKNAMNYISLYLKAINKIEFELIVANLIKLCIMENETNFINPMMVISSIAQNNFKFNITEYIQNFYISISENNYAKAALYLDIIKRMNKIENQNLNLSALSKTLELLEASSADKTMQTNKNEWAELIEEKYNYLLEKDELILLEDISTDDISIILSLANNYSHLSVTIIDGEQKSAVLKIRRFVEGLDIKKNIQAGNIAYKEERYEDVLKLFLPLLHLDKLPSSVISKIALSYLKLNNTREGLKYLIVANDICLKEGKGYDYTYLINQARENLKKDKRTTNNIPNEQPEYFWQEFSKISNLTKEDIETIIKFAVEANLDIKSACEYLFVPKEKIKLVILAIANEFYIQGFSEKGNEFINWIEQYSNDNEDINNLLYIIKQNREASKTQNFKITLSLRLK